MDIRFHFPEQLILLYEYFRKKKRLGFMEGKWKRIQSCHTSLRKDKLGVT